METAIKCGKVDIAKADFMKRFAASKQRKKELVDTLQLELQQEHKSATGFAATNIFVM